MNGQEEIFRRAQSYNVLVVGCRGGWGIVGDDDGGVGSIVIGRCVAVAVAFDIVVISVIVVVDGIGRKISSNTILESRMTGNGIAETGGKGEKGKGGYEGDHPMVS